MVGRLSIKPKKSGQLRHNCLTEENLRLHSYAYPRSSTVPQANTFVGDQTWGESFEPYYQRDEDLEGSDEGDWDAKKVDIALRRAASLEALKIYGGCFTSGFLAMQEPLPWMTPSTTKQKPSHQDVEGLDLRRLASELVRARGGSTETSSRDSDSYIGSPRPDSDTLSRADAEKESGRKWSWRSIGKRGLGASKHACV